MGRLHRVRSDTVQDSLSVLLLRARQSTQGCGKEISDPCLNSISHMEVSNALLYPKPAKEN